MKVFYGLLKEPDINMPLEEEDEPPEGEDKPKVLSASLLNMILGASMNIFQSVFINSILFSLNSIICELLRLQKKKPKKDPLMMKKSKNDPHAPAFNRIPLPEM